MFCISDVCPVKSNKFATCVCSWVRSWLKTRSIDDEFSRTDVKQSVLGPKLCLNRIAVYESSSCPGVQELSSGCPGRRHSFWKVACFSLHEKSSMSFFHCSLHYLRTSSSGVNWLRLIYKHERMSCSMCVGSCVSYIATKFYLPLSPVIYISFTSFVTFVFFRVLCSRG